MERIGIPDTFVEHGPQNLLRSKYGIDAAAIVEAVKRLMTSSRKRQDKWPRSQAV
jgi:1-deoxy-D-xylulose-5-phosphate synthase